LGLFDFLRGVKRPDAGTPTAPRVELEQRLLALNNEQVPFAVAPSAESDLAANWKIVDANWHEIFAKAGLEKSHTILLRLDESKHEARALEEASTVAWEAGVPRLTISIEKTRGRTLGSKEFGTGYAFKGVNPLDFGQVYNYRFNVSEMKDPIIKTVTDSGWSYVPVTSKGKVKR
jgi:outer membrane protein TolC